MATAVWFLLLKFQVVVNHMKSTELKAELERKKAEFALAAEAQKSRDELMVLYKEIKDLQYLVIDAEVKARSRSSDPASSTCLTNKSSGSSPR